MNRRVPTGLDFQSATRRRGGFDPLNNARIERLNDGQRWRCASRAIFSTERNRHVDIASDTS